MASYSRIYSGSCGGYGFKRSKGNKYKNKKVVINGIEFDSEKEGKRFIELHLLQKAGKISDLKMQVKYILIPSQREPDTIGPRGGIKKGKLLEAECSYYADFTYVDTETGEIIVEDTKGVRTKEYVIKRKLMLQVYGIHIKEI